MLVNLGTPASPSKRDVSRYLVEFLTDPRVINLPWLKRQLLVRAMIVPSRLHSSTQAYQAIWTKEGSPLIVHGENVKSALQNTLGDHFIVELAMRYQQPSIANTLNSLLQHSLDHLIILPLFPQYASATTGSVHQKVFEILQHCTVLPKITIIDQFASHPAFIQAFCENAKKLNYQHYDHVLFSFHGLPEQQIRDADKTKQCCLKKDHCCANLTSSNFFCYAAQCHSTAQLICKELSIPEKNWSLGFQSRLGKDPWLRPYMNDMIHELARKGKRKLLVFSPSFVCDCLETTFEIGVEYAKEFRNAGGASLDLVEGLNSNPAWIHALKTIILEV